MDSSVSVTDSFNQLVSLSSSSSSSNTTTMIPVRKPTNSRNTYSSNNNDGSSSSRSSNNRNSSKTTGRFTSAVTNTISIPPNPNSSSNNNNNTNGDGLNQEPLLLPSFSAQSSSLSRRSSRSNNSTVSALSFDIPLYDNDNEPQRYTSGGGHGTLIDPPKGLSISTAVPTASIEWQDINIDENDEHNNTLTKDTTKNNKNNSSINTLILPRNPPSVSASNYVDMVIANLPIPTEQSTISPSNGRPLPDILSNNSSSSNSSSRNNNSVMVVSNNGTGANSTASVPRKTFTQYVNSLLVADSSSVFSTPPPPPTTTTTTTAIPTKVTDTSLLHPPSRPDPVFTASSTVSHVSNHQTSSSSVANSSNILNNDNPSVNSNKSTIDTNGTAGNTATTTNTTTRSTTTIHPVTVVSNIPKRTSTAGLKVPMLSGHIDDHLSTKPNSAVSSSSASSSPSSSRVLHANPSSSTSNSDSSSTAYSLPVTEGLRNQVHKIDDILTTTTINYVNAPTRLGDQKHITTTSTVPNSSSSNTMVSSHPTNNHPSRTYDHAPQVPQLTSSSSLSSSTGGTNIHSMDSTAALTSSFVSMTTDYPPVMVTSTTAVTKGLRIKRHSPPKLSGQNVIMRTHNTTMGSNENRPRSVSPYRDTGNGNGSSSNHGTVNTTVTKSIGNGIFSKAVHQDQHHQHSSTTMSPPKGYSATPPSMMTLTTHGVSAAISATTSAAAAVARASKLHSPNLPHLNSNSSTTVYTLPPQRLPLTNDRTLEQGKGSYHGSHLDDIHNATNEAIRAAQKSAHEAAYLASAVERLDHSDMHLQYMHPHPVHSSFPSSSLQYNYRHDFVHTENHASPYHSTETNSMLVPSSNTNTSNLLRSLKETIALTDELLFNNNSPGSAAFSDSSDSVSLPVPHSEQQPNHPTNGGTGINGSLVTSNSTQSFTTYGSNEDDSPLGRNQIKPLPDTVMNKTVSITDGHQLNGETDMATKTKNNKNISSKSQLLQMASSALANHHHHHHSSAGNKTTDVTVTVTLPSSSSSALSTGTKDSIPDLDEIILHRKEKNIPSDTNGTTTNTATAAVLQTPKPSSAMINDTVNRNERTVSTNTLSTSRTPSRRRSSTRQNGVPYTSLSQSAEETKEMTKLVDKLEKLLTPVVIHQRATRSGRKDSMGMLNNHSSRIGPPSVSSSPIRHGSGGTTNTNSASLSPPSTLSNAAMNRSRNKDTKSISGSMNASLNNSLMVTDTTIITDNNPTNAVPFPVDNSNENTELASQLEHLLDAGASLADITAVVANALEEEEDGNGMDPSVRTKGVHSSDNNNQKDDNNKKNNNFNTNTVVFPSSATMVNPHNHLTMLPSSVGGSYVPFPYGYPMMTFPSGIHTTNGVYPPPYMIMLPPSTSSTLVPGGTTTATGNGTTNPLLPVLPPAVPFMYPPPWNMYPPPSTTNPLLTTAIGGYPSLSTVQGTNTTTIPSHPESVNFRQLVVGEEDYPHSSVSQPNSPTHSHFSQSSSYSRLDVDNGKHTSHHHINGQPVTSTITDRSTKESTETTKKRSLLSRSRSRPSDTPERILSPQSAMEARSVLAKSLTTTAKVSGNNNNKGKGTNNSNSMVRTVEHDDTELREANVFEAKEIHTRRNRTVSPSSAFPSPLSYVSGTEITHKATYPTTRSSLSPDGGYTGPIPYGNNDGQSVSHRMSYSKDTVPGKSILKKSNGGGTLFSLSSSVNTNGGSSSTYQYRSSSSSSRSSSPSYIQQRIQLPVDSLEYGTNASFLHPSNHKYDHTSPKLEDFLPPATSSSSSSTVLRSSSSSSHGNDSSSSNPSVSSIDTYLNHYRSRYGLASVQIPVIPAASLPVGVSRASPPNVPSTTTMMMRNNKTKNNYVEESLTHHSQRTNSLSTGGYGIHRIIVDPAVVNTLYGKTGTGLVGNISSSSSSGGLSVSVHPPVDKSVTDPLASSKYADPSFEQRQLQRSQFRNSILKQSDNDLTLSSLNVSPLRAHITLPTIGRTAITDTAGSSSSSSTVPLRLSVGSKPLRFTGNEHIRSLAASLAHPSSVYSSNHSHHRHQTLAEDIYELEEYRHYPSSITEPRSVTNPRGRSTSRSQAVLVDDTTVGGSRRSSYSRSKSNSRMNTGGRTLPWEKH